MYRRLYPRASIHSFEPFPPSFEELRRNTATDPRTSIHNVAISDKKDIVVLNANTFSATNSLLQTDSRGHYYWGEGLLDTEDQVVVESTSIDLFCRTKSIEHIDILKLDIQGLEYAALQGAKEMLSNQSISVIYTEIILAPTYHGQQPLHAYLAFLDAFGYGLFDFYNPQRKNMQLIQADLLFISNTRDRMLRQSSL